MNTGYFFCADILGFKTIVSSLNSELLESRIDEWVTFVKAIADKFGITKYQLISDSIFSTLDNDEDIDKLIAFARALLNEGILKSFPIRGAICYGDFNWGELIYGKTIVEAYKYEQNQNWIGILVDDTCIDKLNKDKKLKGLNLITYPVPMRQKEIKLYRTISWSVPKFEKLAELLTSNGFGGQPNVGKTLDWNWGEKIGNTVVYGLYLLALEKCGKTGERFHGMHPIHFIDKTLRN